MSFSRHGVFGVALALSVMVLVGCTPQQHVIEGSEVTVVADQPFTSANPATSYGNTATNRAIAYATNSRFVSYDADGNLRPDDSFGSYRVESKDPLVVTYTIANGVTWSDGVPVDAADLLLAWAANSGVFTTEGFAPGSYTDSATGLFTDDYPDDVVYFDGAPASGLENVTRTPTMGSDGRSITLTYDSYFVDWQLAFEVGMPAHVVAERAWGGDDAVAAKAAAVSAIQSADTGALAELSREWNTAFVLDSMPTDGSVLVSSGPYSVTGIEPGESVTLTANPLYRGRNQPNFETVRVVTLTDPLAIAAAFSDGEVDVATFNASTDITNAFADLDGVQLDNAVSGTWEHIDLQFTQSKNGTFDDPRVREAFLKVVPRREILDALVSPVNPDAPLLNSQIFVQNAPGYSEAVASNGSGEYARVDLPGARRLLADAGVESPRVCILFDPTNLRRISEVALIRQSAARVGFVVDDCSRPGWVDFLGVAGTYDAALYGWNTSNLAVSGAAARLGSDSDVSNFNGYSSPEVDAMLTQLSTTSDESAQRSLLEGIDARLWADAYGLPLYQYPVVVARSERVTGIEFSAFEPGVMWNLWNWQPSGDGESTSPTR
ncbi:MAG: ABC transporter family substrate-binding protein [Microbacteriaceae bacterium]